MVRIFLVRFWEKLWDESRIESDRVREKQERVQKYNTGRLGGANGYYPKVKRFIKISGMELIECREITVVVNFVIRGFKF